MSASVKLRAGSLNASGELEVGSMARAIDDRLATLVPIGAGEDPHGRRKLILAIAQGVIDHLVANHDAFVVTVPVGAGTVERFVRIDI
jgi:hypothetical protein